MPRRDDAQGLGDVVERGVEVDSHLAGVARTPVVEKFEEKRSFNYLEIITG